MGSSDAYELQYHITSLVQTMARRLFRDNTLSGPMRVCYQLDSNMQASVSYTITGSDNGRPPAQWQPIIWTMMVSCQLSASINLYRHWFRQRPIICSATVHYLKQFLMICCQLDYSKSISRLNHHWFRHWSVAQLKKLIQKNVYESVKCSSGTQFVRPWFAK